MFLEITFWTFVFLVFYTYVGYPLLLLIFTAFRKNRATPQSETLPHVSLVISAYNEESIIGRKLDNSLELDYPKEKIEIVVASDNSSDRTNEIVKSYQDDSVRLFENETRSGKTRIQNLVVRNVRGEIIVFSDANAMYDPDAIGHLVKHFADQKVGCVCGELQYANYRDSVSGSQENIYWDYEKFLKRKENLFGTILGVNGSIYAVRKKCYIPLPANLISDFIEPLKIFESGSRVVYEPKAISSEESSGTFREEFTRKKRIILRSISSLFWNSSLLNPFKNPTLSFQLISHKILRWCVPLLLLGIFILNLFLLESHLFQYLFCLQLAFYALAILGYSFEKKNWRASIIYAPFYFVMVNFAAFLAIVEFLKGKNIVAWEPSRNLHPVEESEEKIA